MSEGMNKAILLGNLGQDPELRYTSGNDAVMDLRVATTERYKSGEEWKERTEWHTVVVWGKRAEALAKILSKGSRIAVEGRISTTTTGEGDAKKYYTKVVAENVYLCGGGAERSNAGDAREPRDDRPRGSGGGSSTQSQSRGRDW